MADAFSLQWLIQAIIFILPAYVANAVPVIFGGGAPIDSGKKFLNGKRLLGEGKTWRGLLSGIAAGFLAGAILAFTVPAEYAYGLATSQRIALAFLLSAGALVGDLAGSFAKRRVGLPRGYPFLLMDQLPFLFMALIFAFPVRVLSLEELVFLAVITPVLHAVANRIAHFLKLKKVPW
ncbi:MAG: CDP-2,3-bis-(O-geranylgeranyl)-sn-glycerol synthase [Candidatus Micrarchaeota archaeon]|nr:CDP-2,3-bis-(O-geranylgeranyl)-sn-glycerol synthase [Candidatus Micrarchaeota archaeon]